MAVQRLEYVEPVRTQGSYLDCARAGRPSGWLYLAGFVTIIVAWFGIDIVMTLPLGVAGRVSPDGELSLGSIWADNLFALLSFIPLLVAVPLVVRWFHGRPWQSVITPFRRINWRMILVGVGVWLVILGAVQGAGVALGIDKIEWSFTASVVIPNAIVCVLFLFFQTSAEELLFRGYIPQWLSLATRNIWIQGLVVGFAFMVPHMLNPEVIDLGGIDYWIGVANYFVIGFALAWISIKSGTIELALGVHFINNIFAFIVVGSSDGVGGAGSLFAIVDSNLLGSLAETTLAAVLLIAVTWKIRGNGVLMPMPVPKPRPLPAYSYPAPAWGVYPGFAAVAPGWFPDPYSQWNWRYWDGQYWTPFTAPIYELPLPGPR